MSSDTLKELIASASAVKHWKERLERSKQALAEAEENQRVAGDNLTKARMAHANATESVEVAHKRYKTASEGYVEEALRTAESDAKSEVQA